jgi:uncharacterized protein YndB with AHSA1/START domain
MKNEPIIIERVYHAPVEKVWHAITDLEQMRQWYFPALVEFEPEIGFETRFDVEHTRAKFFLISGRSLRSSRAKRLAMNGSSAGIQATHW